MASFEELRIYIKMIEEWVKQMEVADTLIIRKRIDEISELDDDDKELIFQFIIVCNEPLDEDDG